MAQRRDNKLLVYLEPILRTAVTQVVNKTDQSHSEYIRGLVIADLKERGLLTDRMIAENLC
jgi:hypothetical protein